MYLLSWRSLTGLYNPALCLGYLTLIMATFCLPAELILVMLDRLTLVLVSVSQSGLGHLLKITRHEA